jgi:hypothetical protein
MATLRNELSITATPGKRMEMLPVACPIGAEQNPGDQKPLPDQFTMVVCQSLYNGNHGRQMDCGEEP